MYDFLLVRIAKDFRDLAHKIELHGDVELVFALSEEVIEPNALGIMLKNDGRTEFMLRETVGAENPAMFECFEDLEFPQRSPLDGLPVFRCGAGPYKVETNTAFRSFKLGVGSLPILITWALSDEFFENVVADFAMTLRRTDSGLLQCLANDFRHRPVVRTLRCSGKTVAFPPFYGSDDSWMAGGAGGRVSIPKTDVEAAVALKFASQVRG